MVHVNNTEALEASFKRKRERSTNFTDQETQLLVSLVLQKKRIIEKKKSDAVTWQDKEKTWKEIEVLFNSASGSVFRTHKHLKQKYDALKRDTRKKSAVIHSKQLRTEGGTSTALKLTPIEEKVMELILLSPEENEAQRDNSDSDSIQPSTSTSDPVNEGQMVEPWMQVEVSVESSKGSKDEYFGRKVTEIKEDGEPPNKKEYDETGDYDESEAEETEECRPKHKKPYDILIEEKIEIARLQRKIYNEELIQKHVQRLLMETELELKRNILEKELEYKSVKLELEKEEHLLKIQILKKELEK